MTFQKFREAENIQLELNDSYKRKNELSLFASDYKDVDYGIYSVSISKDRTERTFEISSESILFMIENEISKLELEINSLESKFDSL